MTRNPDTTPTNATGPSRMMRPLARAILAVLVMCSPLAAQSRDSTFVRALHVSTDSLIRLDSTVMKPWCALTATTATRKKACVTIARLHRRVDSTATAFWPRVSPAPVPVPTPPPVPVPVPTPTPTPTPVPPPVIIPPPPIGAMVGPVTVAELPRGSLSTAYPDTSQQHGVNVAGGSSLQAMINTAHGGDVLLLAPCSTWIGNFTLPVRPDATTVVIRTNVNVGPEGQRMTPTRAASLCLAKILSPTAAPAIATLPSANGWRLTGVEVSTTPAVESMGMNRLISFGNVASNGQTTLASVPHDLLVDRSYVHGTSTLDLSKTLTLNCANCGAVDSWLADAHSRNYDANAVWAGNGTANVLVQNNYLEASHEVVAFGGDDPTTDSLSPRDITVRGNHITRPLAWKGVWHAKNLLESKNARRLLLEGNIFENNWSDAQDGTAIVLKSENQTGAAPFSQTADVTIRDNLIRCTGKGFRFGGYGSNYPTPSVAAARITVTNNVVTGMNVAPCTGDGTAIHLMNAVRDALFVHNTILNPPTGYGLLLEGLILPTLAVHSNAYGNGASGALKTGGGTVGTSSLNAQVTSSLYANNFIFNLASCTDYPVTTLCANALPATLPLGYDGKPIGADTARVNAITARVVVQP